MKKFFRSKKAMDMGAIVVFLLLALVVGYIFYSKFITEPAQAAVDASSGLTESTKACLDKEDGAACYMGNKVGTCQNFHCVKVARNPEQCSLDEAPGKTCRVCSTPPCDINGELLPANRIEAYMVCDKEGACITKCAYCAGLADSGKPAWCTGTEPRTITVGQGYYCKQFDTTSCNDDANCVRGFCPEDNKFCSKSQ